MFEKAMTYFGYRFAKFQFRSDVDAVQPMTEFFRNAKSVLVVLPVGYEHAIIAGDALRNVCKHLKHLQLTVINNSTRETSLSEFAKCEVVRLNPEDLNSFSLPKKQVMQRIFSREYDVAIDLNLDFVLHSAYICKASRAKVRVGSAHAVADQFYNVQLKLRESGSPQEFYRKFAACMAMF
jgi:hypothetical protein